MNSNATRAETSDIRHSTSVSPSLIAILLKAPPRLVGFLIQILTAGRALRVYRKPMEDGRTLWIAYDPMANASLRTMSEAEVRAWLDQRSRYF